jgi:hypothetical protein
MADEAFSLGAGAGCTIASLWSVTASRRGGKARDPVTRVAVFALEFCSSAPLVPRR